MKKLILAGALAVTAFSTSCSSTHASKYGAPATAITETVIAKPIVEKGQATSGTASSISLFFGLLNFGPSKFAEGASLPASSAMDPFATVKSAASYEACAEAGYDMLLAPNYVLDVDNYYIFKKVTCRVKGYGATIKGIQSLETRFVKPDSKGSAGKKSILPF